ncbi:hypothetical protein HBH53_101830 [Parastagonospora nodorum]|nr:hypothetical protein HBH53_101830 [Parastagonospora nodorum]
MATTTIRELGARHSLSNLSVHDLVEEFARHLAVATCLQLRDAQTPPVFREAAAAIICYIIVTELQHFGNEVETKDPRNTLTLTLSKTAQLRSSDIDTLTVTPIKDDDNLLNTINSHIKLRKLKEYNSIPTNYLNSPHYPRRESNNFLFYQINTLRSTLRSAKRTHQSRQRLESEAQLRKASEEEELAKTKKEKREKEARERKAGSDGLLDSDDYRSDSSPDIDPKDDSEDEEATTAKDLAREQKERLKALLNAKYNERQSLCESRDGNRTLHSGRRGYCDSTLYQLIGAYILYFKELSSDNSRIFASVMGMTRTRAIVLLAIIGHVHFKN